MSVLTEITNSDKDILLSGDCTIKTKLITSKERLPIQIYDGIYDSENDSYYILGESTQETSTQGKNIVPTDFSEWESGEYALVDGSKTPVESRVRVKRLIAVKPNTTYYVKTSTFCFVIREYNASGAFTRSIGGLESIKGTTFTTSENGYYIGVSLYTGTNYEDYKTKWADVKPFICLNSVSDKEYADFTPNMPSPDYPSEVKNISGTIGIKTKKDTVVVVDLEDNELCGITAKDKLTIKDGKATITKNINKSILDSSGNWQLYEKVGSTPRRFGLRDTNVPENLSMISNYFVCKSKSEGKQTDLSLWTQLYYYAITDINSYWMNTTEFKTWLSTHNTAVYYELVTPQEITLTNVNTYTIQTLTEENSVKDWEISDDRYVENNGVIGQFVARDISGNLQNISDDFNIENNYVQVQMGISQFKSNITNWYSLGSFLIVKPSDDEVSDNTKYNGYDLATLFNIDFNPKYVNKDFPKSFNQMLEEQKYVTNKWLANYVCAQVEVELATQDFIHNDFQVLSNQFTSGESCRDVMRYIAQLAFGYCEIGWDDKCYIRTLINDYSSFDDYHKLNYDTYYNLETQKNEYGPINRVFCGLQDVNGQGKENIDKSTIENGVTTINIYNNPLTMGTTLEISEQLRAQVVKDCGVLWGIKYRPITNMETIGHPWFKANEPIQVSDMENKTFITYPFNNTLKYTGHIKSEISSEGTTKAEDTYGYKDSVERRMNRIGINVDRANEKITIINQKITQIGDDIEDIRGNMIEIGDVYTKSEIKDIVSGVGVDGTVVTSVETATTIFDINGMTVGRTDSPTKTNINSNGMIITNANDNTELLKINNSGVYSENLTARTYLNFGTHGRFEKYTENNRTRIGCFWIEGDE